MRVHKIKDKRRWYVYIVRCADGRLYTGMTTDIARRMKAHAAGTGARFTRSAGFGGCVFTQGLRGRSAAARREAEIKRWSRARKEMLIASRPAACKEMIK